MTMDRKIDAIVVGLGAAGGIIASELAVRWRIRAPPSWVTVGLN